MKKEKFLKPVGKLKGGIKIPNCKNTEGFLSEILPPPPTVIIPMLQHIGTPCTPTVNVGDKVFVGTVVGNGKGSACVPIHSSVSGKVKKISEITLETGDVVKAVEIKSDGKMLPDENIKPRKVTTPAQLKKAAKDSGLVGLGGAGFPTYIKLSPSPEQTIDTLIVNAAECEPYITSDYREILENPEDVLGGALLIKNVLNIKNVIIAVEKNKPLALKTLCNIVANQQNNDGSIKIMKLKSKYPQGAEKMLIYSATKRKLPADKLPLDIGCLVMNVTSVAFLYRFIKTGMPLVSRRITVDGDAVNEPKNLIVPIGTPISYILNYCKAADFERVIMGGPMMGTSVSNTKSPILKQNNAVLAFKKSNANTELVSECIRCGRCISACPMGLLPARIAKVAKTGNIEAVKPLHPLLCLECGSCSFICPAKIPLAKAMHTVKEEIRKAGK